MKRLRRPKVKEEKPEPSHSRENEEHDLAYYIHDRVELMHQVFSVLKLKELKSMIPDCIRHVSKADLQELCTEELLGISSKRLCAILDGAEPPSDTESSSQSERLETISLDSISSDEEILSSGSKKKKHKHKKHSKSKRKRSVNKDIDRTDKQDGGETQSRAARAGLTVLELLELQARARAIRAQLHKEQSQQVSTSEPPRSNSHSSDEDAVQIKEEPPQVVEISSDEEKPSVASLEADLAKPTTSVPNQTATTVHTEPKDLTGNVPVTKKTRKIVLNRTKSVIANTNPTDSTDTVTLSNKTDPVTSISDVPCDKTTKNKGKEIKKVKKNKKKKANNTDGSDHDEITLQLSDSEKMDLLDDFEGKKHDVSSLVDSDSSSSGSDESVDAIVSSKNYIEGSKDFTKTFKQTDEGVKSTEKHDAVINKAAEGNPPENVKETALDEVKTELESIGLSGSPEKENVNEANQSVEEIEANIETQLNISATDSNNAKNDVHNEEEPMDIDDIHVEVTNVNNLSIVVVDNSYTKEIVKRGEKESAAEAAITENQDKFESNTHESSESTKDLQNKTLQIVVQGNSRSVTSKSTELKPVSVVPDNNADKHMSEGELSNAGSLEIEVIDLKPEVVCISDEEDKKSKHKKKKKEKKAKKDKKKTESDFRNSADQNFFTKNLIEIVDQNDSTVNDKVNLQTNNSPKRVDKNPSTDISRKTDSSVIVNDVIDDDIYEIMELSDSSSCYEVEGVSVLSKEPTADEIEALSAKIDELEREEVVTEEQIKEYEIMQAAKEKNKNETEELVSVSWKDRYLDSKKVKQVLSTSNILNAMRKKNIELKKKIAESKKETAESMKEIQQQKEEAVKVALEDGSLEQYNTLIGSTKFVNPVPEKQNSDATDDIDTNLTTTENDGELKEKQITSEMKKDAKQLLKMYKKLLKYNDMHKPSDPNKKKKKKMKKIKSKQKKVN